MEQEDILEITSVPDGRYQEPSVMLYWLNGLGCKQQNPQLAVT